MKCVQGLEVGDLPTVFRFIVQDGGIIKLREEDLHEGEEGGGCGEEPG